jgi:hypothetical protein
MNTLFKHVLNGMIENNRMHGAEFKDFDDAEHAIEIYANTFVGDVEEAERQATIVALNKIIKSNGAEIEQAIESWNVDVWGQNFANNFGSTPFGG